MSNGVIEKRLSFQKESREQLFKGVKILADAVCTTLGPKGRNVAIQRQWGLPIVVHDGVTVAREVEDSDELVAIGVSLVREAAQKTNEEAGDGTTTATLLAYELIKRGMTLLDEGVNPMVLRNQIYAVLPVLVKELKRLSKPIKSNKEVARVASISSGDDKIGALVAEAVKKVGKDGLVTVDEGKTSETIIEYTEGFEIDKGYISNYFITNLQRMEAIIEDPIIALVDKKLTLNNEIVPLVERMAQISKDIVIVAEDIKGDALGTLIGNKMKGNINAVAIQTPGIGDNKANYLADLATLTGGQVLSDQTGINIQQEDAWLGRAERVVVSKSMSVFVGGKGDKKAIDQRIKDLRTQRDESDSTFEKEKIEERLAKLSTGVAVIKVGAKTEIDMRERVEKVKDAVGAATAAREEGVVPGGGTIFLQLSKVLKGETEGERILREVLESPARKLMQNSGENNETINVYVKEILATTSKESSGWGYEIKSGVLCDLIDSGIIDPAKVVRLALENAIGVGTSILTTDCLIAIKYDRDKDKTKVRR